MLTVGGFAEMVEKAMDHQPTDQQRALIGALARFCSGEAPRESVFIINGYAGTGKTSVVAALVKALEEVKRPTVLLAPTGRAAKVLSRFAGRPAHTIHRKIYKQDPLSMAAVAGVADNPHTGAVFVVDEASMIGAAAEGQPSLLDDLVQYVYSGDNCRMILLGDTAQLPPVGCETSPAMTPEALKAFGLRVSRAVLTQTVRQTSGSGILYNATSLRRAMAAATEEKPLTAPRLVVRPFDDVDVVGPEDLSDDLQSAYSESGVTDTIVISRSNRRAMEFNLAIRRDILEKEEELTRGEPVLIARNNYFWPAKTGVRGGDFLANGDIAYIDTIYTTELRGMLRFADVRLSLPDRGLALDAKILLNSLTATTATLNPEHEQMLLEQTLRAVEPGKNPAITARQDPYFNALLVKYAYAVTCHKAQGGQWDHAFVDLGGIPPEGAASMEFHRWLYTAVTRAKRRLSLIAPTLEVT